MCYAVEPEPILTSLVVQDRLPQVFFCGDKPKVVLVGDGERCHSLQLKTTRVQSNMWGFSTRIFSPLTDTMASGSKLER